MEPQRHQTEALSVLNLPNYRLAALSQVRITSFCQSHYHGDYFNLSLLSGRLAQDMVAASL